MKNSILKVKRVKINKNLGTIYFYKKLHRIDLDADYPTSWEDLEFKDYQLTRIYLFSGRIIHIQMDVDEFESLYLESKRLYELEAKQMPDIIPN
jgi:hypothetical protein